MTIGEQTSLPLPGSGTVDTIPVHISYEIIRLFSEGLYQSPHKAIEELVSNGYDAQASSVHILLPEAPDDADEALPPLWVIDDGQGMDSRGFHRLWRVADSDKANISGQGLVRPPIGQFGIGKLAAYVLAWRLTHISKVSGSIRMTSMNFRDLEGKHQFEDASPLMIDLYELSESQAREHLAPVEGRDPVAWNRLFGPEASSTWTAAALSDFKNLYGRLHAGQLGWVLSTGLPLHSDFEIWLNGQRLESSKERKRIIAEFEVGETDDVVAERMGLTRCGPGVQIDGIKGVIHGKAQIFEDRLTAGKSEQYGRSHGFFVRVRGRVINLEDELFGLDALNHAAWSRFAMELNADGLRDYLLSSREGVRESESIRTLRRYLHGVFNACRAAYGDWAEKDIAGIDIRQLLSDAPSLFVTEPLLGSVMRTLQSGSESFYITRPQLSESVEHDAWIASYEENISKSPFSRVIFEESGEYDRALRYVPETRTLVINSAHPFVNKLLSLGRSNSPATLFGTSEVMMDALLQDHGINQLTILDFMKDRDRVLRLLAGDQPSTAAEVLRRLSIANRNETTLERAVGMAFRVLGFEYERRGGNEEGPDGVLYARLGRDVESLSDYKVVYDSKQTSQPAVPADKINLDSIDDFRRAERANFAFFVALKYANENDPDGKLNRLVSAATIGADSRPVTLLRIDDLRRIVELHYRYGVTLSRLRTLFESAHTVPEVKRWVQELERELTNLEPPVPLRRLLEGIEEAKTDAKARPNINGVRAVTLELKEFTPERLIAALRAVETIVGSRWLEVEASGDVRLHHNAEQILAEVHRNLINIFGVDALDHHEIIKR